MDDKINLQEIINYCKENGFIFLFISPFLLLLSIDLLSLQDLQQDSLLSILFACGSFLQQYSELMWYILTHVLNININVSLIKYISVYM